MRKLNCSLLFSGLLFLCFNAQAQGIALGFRGGVSVPNLTAGGGVQNPLNSGYSSRFGADGGIFAELKFTKTFSVQVMAEYSSQGGKKDGFQALTVPPALAAQFPPGYAPAYLYATYNSQAKLNYLLIPVLAKFGWNLKHTPLRLYFDAGPFAGFLLSAHQVTSGSSPLYTSDTASSPISAPQSFNNTQDLKSQLHSANFGIEGNIGIAFHFGKSSLFFEAGGNYGFLNIQQGTANGKNNTGAATAVVGYSYLFGR